MPRIATEVGKTYRDTIKNVVGVAVARNDDGMTQLQLHRQHIEGSPECVAAHAEGRGAEAEMMADLRWYEEDRLELAK